MTTATPPSPSTRDGDEVDDIAAIVDEQRAPRRAVRSRWWRIGYPIVLVLLLLAIPALVFAGLRTILDSTDGQLVRRVTDPSAPGYEAVVELTPTQLVVAVGPDGSLDSLSLLALTSRDVGGVMTIPATTLAPFPGGPLSLAYVHDNLGVDVLREQVSTMLDLDIADVQVVGSADWEADV
ncbi:MAG TPA: hypothetical protein VIY72_01900, partial [Acidimicrobiales bacterium]